MRHVLSMFRWTALCRRISLTLLGLFLIQTTGCATWHREPTPVPRAATFKPDDTYRITLTDSQSVHLTHVRILGDSLFGLRDSARVVHGEADYAKVPMAVPLVRVIRMERQATHGLLVAGGILAALFAVGGIAFALSCFMCN